MKRSPRRARTAVFAGALLVGIWTTHAAAQQPPAAGPNAPAGRGGQGGTRYVHPPHLMTTPLRIDFRRQDLERLGGRSDLLARRKWRDHGGKYAREGGQTKHVPDLARWIGQGF